MTLSSGTKRGADRAVLARISARLPRLPGRWLIRVGPVNVTAQTLPSWSTIVAHM